MIDNISRQDAMNAVLDCKVKYNGEISDAVLNMITTEIAESIKIIPSSNDGGIIRCRDCKYSYDHDEKYCACTQFKGYFWPLNGYCCNAQSSASS